LATDPTTSPAGEPELIARLKAGDDGAFAELVRQHSGRMLAVAKRICPADADDVLQEAFLSAFKKIGSFDGRSLLGTWLYRITVNAALMKRRAKSRRPEISIDALLPRFKNGYFEAAPVELSASVTKDGGLGIEERESFWAAVDRLPEEFRAVLVLRDIAQMESSAVAVSLEISDALVRQRLHRARLALVKLLQASGFDKDHES
jgi:RNA polymerase sigma-70 factor (ECF subfamily)